MWLTSLLAMLAMQFGGPDNIQVDCRNHSAKKRVLDSVKCVQVKRVCKWMCVISERKGILFKPLPPFCIQEVDVRAGHLGSQLCFPLDPTVQRPFYSTWISIHLVRHIVSSCLIAHSLRQVHTLNDIHIRKSSCAVPPGVPVAPTLP